MADRKGPFQPGDRFLDKYEIRELIGKGGQAFVYDAYSAFMDRSVAIKIIPSMSHRAQTEARVLGSLEHKNIVRILDAGGLNDDLVYLIMEKLAGRTLRAALRDYGKLSPAEVLELAAQVADGVAEAHAKGVVHRDLKPENIFLQADNQVKVLDFGIAKVVGLGDTTTQKELFPGTLLYMSPEQLKGLGVSPRSDIYSLGTVLYEAMHDHPALIGRESPTTAELGWIQLQYIPPSLSELDPGIPGYVAGFVQRAILKNPAKRYQSMTEMAKAARQALERLREETQRSHAVLVRRDLSLPKKTPSEVPGSPPPDLLAKEHAPAEHVPPSLAPAVSTGGDTRRYADVKTIGVGNVTLPAWPPAPAIQGAGADTTREPPLALLHATSDATAGNESRPASSPVPPRRPSSRVRPLGRSRAGVAAAASLEAGQPADTERLNQELAVVPPVRAPAPRSATDSESGTRLAPPLPDRTVGTSTPELAVTTASSTTGAPFPETRTARVSGSKPHFFQRVSAAAVIAGIAAGVGYSAIRPAVPSVAARSVSHSAAPRAATPSPPHALEPTRPPPAPPMQAQSAPAQPSPAASTELQPTASATTPPASGSATEPSRSLRSPAATAAVSNAEHATALKPARTAAPVRRPSRPKTEMEMRLEWLEKDFAQKSAAKTKPTASSGL